MKNTKEFILSEMNVAKAIRTLAIPAIMGTMITAIYNFVDTAFIGLLQSTQALSAVAIAFPIMSLINAIGQVLGVGVATYLGILLGAKKHKEANESATTIIVLSIFLAIIIAILGVVFQEPILTFFGASSTVLPYAKQYGTWMFIGAIFTIPNQALNNVARAETNAKLSAIALGLGALLNIILDPIFMFDFGLGLGLEGASIATTVAQGCSFIFLLLYFLRGKSLFKLSIKHIKFSSHMLKEVLKTGAPSGASQVLVSISIALTNIIAGRFGDVVIAALGIVLKVISFGQFIIFGYVQGFQPIASYAQGANDKQRFKDAFQTALRFVLRTCICLTIVYGVFGKWILMIFTSDQGVLDVAFPILLSQIVLYIAMGIVIFMTSVFQSLGQGLRGIILSISRQGIFFIPLILTLPIRYNLPGLYVVQPIADIFSLALAYYYYRKIKTQYLTIPEAS